MLRMRPRGTATAAAAVSLMHPSGFSRSAGTIALAIIVTGFPVVAHLSGQAVGLATCFVLAALLANFAAPALPPVLIFSYVFQNLFVSLVSPYLVSVTEFNTIRAYNFVLTATVWMVIVVHYWPARHRFDRQFNALMIISFAALGLVGLYFAIGVLSDPRSAAVYLRNVAMPFMLFQIFAIVAYRYRLSIHGAFVVIGLAIVVYGYCEALLHKQLFWLINGDAYFDLAFKPLNEGGGWLRQLRQTGQVMRSNLDMLVIDLLNTPLFGDLGVKIHRLTGPNFHSISYAYALAFFALILGATGSLFYVLLALPLMILIGSKGALILVVYAFAGLFASRLIRHRWLIWVYVAGLLVYAAIGIVIGIRHQDYHVIGFIGGIEAFPSGPLGRGLGAGGNLSLDPAQIDWGRSQNQGHTDVPVESAIGVLLYQMGLSGIVLVSMVLWIAWKGWDLYIKNGDRLTGIVALALMSIVVNGIFQEEALFAPLALGAMTALAGLTIGRALRGSRTGERPLPGIAASAPPYPQPTGPARLRGSTQGAR